MRCDARKKNYHHHIVVDWDLFTCGYVWMFFSLHFCRQTTFDLLYFEHVYQSKRRRKKIFSMINRRAIYCDLIDFLCGKQLKRSSCARGMKTLIEKWFELCSIYKQPSAILFFLLLISIQLYLWHMLLKDWENCWRLTLQFTLSELKILSQLIVNNNK